MTRDARIAVFLVVGAVVATGGDALHVRAGTLSYPSPALPTGQAWFVFPGFVAAFSLMAAVYAAAARALSLHLAVARSTSPGEIGAFVEALAAFAFVYGMSAYGHDDPTLLAALFYGGFVARWAFTYERAWALGLALLLAVGGVVGEGLMAAGGLVAYAHAEVFHVPWWLGGLYMHGALALREGMRWAWGAEEAG